MAQQSTASPARDAEATNTEGIALGGQETRASSPQVKKVAIVSALREAVEPCLPSKPTTGVRKRRRSVLPEHTCAMCPGEGSIKCGKCELVRYCSEECQENDAQVHTMLCESLASFETPPSESHRRAIVFDENPENATARFIWLRVHRNVDEDGSEYDQPNLGEFLKSKDGRVRSTITKNHVLWRPLSHSIHIEHYLPNAHGWDENSAVSKVVDCRYTPRNTWISTILVYATEPNSRELPKIQHLGPQDFRSIVDFLNTSKSCALASDIRYFGKTVQGVRLNCKGDMAEPAARPAIEAVQVPLTHCLFDDSVLLPIPSKLDLPILAARCLRKPEYEKDIELYKGAGALSQSWLLERDERRATTSILPLDHHSRRAYYQGTLVLARQDQKPLFPEHIEALWRYVKYFLEPMMADASSIHADEDARENVQKEITTEKFQLYYRHFQTFQDTEDERKKPSPYDVVRKKGSLKRKSSGSFFNDPKRAKWSWSSETEDAEPMEEEEL
ncbi:uncharacterized protein EI97DRAFT_458425 [Westerdykella ornata]|uniref:MYND-type domain-containing protein n=1 Tax=Westerdykella ornata TaxID=318751 RepID=A0A6A6JIM5_WESOR|nr:uncharacterized protein EI97DRAFT_458425 [Westerdykella ornata]KAF2276500.1 hypothetical protein EI97DRAFT_458425 [Westerdykella ornata]